MDPLYIRVIETTIAVLILIIIRKVVANIVSKRLLNAEFGKNRAQLTSKLFNVLYSAILLISLAGIWGLHGSQVVTFIGTALTVVGIGFFAQWSLLSNITSGLILFFNHPLKLGDYISIVDKDFPLEGKIDDITLFFIYIRDKQDRVFSISNTIMMTKTFRVMGSSDVEDFLQEKEEIEREEDIKPNEPDTP